MLQIITADFFDIRKAAVEFLFGLPVFKQDRHFRVQRLNPVHVVFQVQDTISARHFVYAERIPFAVKRAVLHVTASDTVSQKIERPVHDSLVIDECRGTVQEIGSVHMHGEPFPVHILHELQVLLRRIRRRSFSRTNRLPE